MIALRSLPLVPLGVVLMANAVLASSTEPTVHAQKIARLQAIDEVEVVALNEKVLFVAGAHNDFELYISDGTFQGTGLLADIHPRGSSRPRTLTRAGNAIFFSADDGVAGREIWCSDGTRRGTFLVYDVYPGPDGSDPTHLVDMGGVIYFVADDGWSGSELWRSDGTPDGTYQVADINPGPPASRPGRMVVAGDRLFFAATHFKDGRELYRSDGTTAGTVMVSDVVTDGSLAPENLVAWRDKVVFTGETAHHGREVWVSDGTSRGTQLLGDIFPGPSGSNADHLFAGTNFVCFQADDGQFGRELWKTDGTRAGTQLVQDLNPTRASSFPDGFVDLGDVVLFAADGRLGRELWRTDGTAAGTSMVRDINGGRGSAFRNPTDLPDPIERSLGRRGFPRRARLGAGSIHVANDGFYGPELWYTDGTREGTYMVANINAFGGIRDVLDDQWRLGFADLGDRVIFAVECGHGPGLWAVAPGIDGPLHH